MHPSHFCENWAISTSWITYKHLYFGFCTLAEHSLVYLYQQRVTIHHLSKSMSCHKDILVIIGRVYCFYDWILHLSCFCKIWAFCCSWITYYHLNDVSNHYKCNWYFLLHKQAHISERWSNSEHSYKKERFWKPPWISWLLFSMRLFLDFWTCTAKKKSHARDCTGKIKIESFINPCIYKEAMCI